MLPHISNIMMVLSVIIFLFFALYYCLVVSRRPVIISGNGKLKCFLKTHVNILKRRYWPNLFFWGGTLQTIFSLTKRFKHPNKVPYKREIFKLRDGGEIAIDYMFPEPSSEGGYDETLVVLLPGLTSSSRTSYVQSLARSIVDYGGAHLAVVNNRGLGGVPLKTPKTFCASNCEDLREVLNYLKNRFFYCKILPVGTSLGGMVLAHYIIQYPEEAKENMSAALLLSIIWDAWAATKSIERPLNRRLINYQLATSLRTMATKYQYILEDRKCFDYQKILQSKTLREIDASYTAPSFGYSSLDEYYDHVTITNRLQQMTVPVIALNSYDDPMMPGPDLPYKYASKKDSNLALVVTRRGGHLGFLEGWTPNKRPGHYMEKFVGQFVKAFCKHNKELGC